MRCYYDGSIGGQSDEWLTLAGFAASDDTWAAFQKAWEAMLKDRDPIAPYVHMTDLITGNNGFSRDDGWGVQNVDRLVSDVESLLFSFGRKMCAVACAMDIQARKRLVREGHPIPDPAVVCAEIGLGGLMDLYLQKHDIELAHLFYDQKEPFIRSIRRKFLKFQEENPQRITTDLMWGIIANVQPVSMRDTPGIQAADVVAWAFTRRLRNAEGDKWTTLANNLLGTREYRGILTNMQCDPMDEAYLRRAYPKPNS